MSEERGCRFQNHENSLEVEATSCSLTTDLMTQPGRQVENQGEQE